MAFPAFLDTNVLYGAALSDTLLRIAEQGAFRPHWSPDVLSELRRNLIGSAKLTEEQADRRIDQMKWAFPDASLHGYEGLMDGLSCDPKDRHVLAAAIHGQCQVIVTFNTRDFPPGSLEGRGVEAVHPQDFLLDQLDLYPHAVKAALRAQAAAARRPELSATELQARLRRAGVADFVDEVRLRFGDELEPPSASGRRFRPG